VGEYLTQPDAFQRRAPTNTAAAQFYWGFPGHPPTRCGRKPVPAAAWLPEQCDGVIWQALRYKLVAANVIK
jgi:hypothetical protein